MAKVNAQEFVDKWGRRTKAATQDYVNGINRVTEAPGQAAAKSVDRMRQGINDALDSGRWAAKVSGVSLQEWQQKAAEKGAQRIASGVDGATATMQQKAERLLQDIDASVAVVKRMPKTTLEDRINRMVTYTREMSKRKQ